MSSSTAWLPNGFPIGFPSSAVADTIVRSSNATHRRSNTVGIPNSTHSTISNHSTLTSCLCLVIVMTVPPTRRLPPEYRAIEFLADEYYSNSGELLSSNWLRQRYALTTMYFALGGPHWTNQLGVFSSRHECQWSGIESTLILGVIYISIGKLTKWANDDGRCSYAWTPNHPLRSSANNKNGTWTIPEQIGYCTSMML